MYIEIVFRTTQYKIYDFSVLSSYITELNETQKQIVDVASKFAKEEVAPVAAYHDETGEYPIKLVKRAWELGLANSSIPEHCGK